MSDTPKLKQSLTGETYGRKTKEEKQQEAQKNLKEKYNIDEDEKVVVVEKSYLFVGVLKTILNVVIYICAVIGLIAIIFPPTREALISALSGVLSQVRGFFS